MAKRKQVNIRAIIAVDQYGSWSIAGTSADDEASDYHLLESWGIVHEFEGNVKTFIVNIPLEVPEDMPSNGEFCSECGRNCDNMKCYPQTPKFDPISDEPEEFDVEF